MQQPGSQTDSREALTKAIWLLVAFALNALELFIPRIPFLPWLKPGLSNAITMLWVIRYGTSDALLYGILRIWISGFYFGFSILTLGLALGGGILSTLIMGVMWRVLGNRGLLGTIGLGMAGALAHNAGQLAMVYLLMSRNALIFYQVPFMLAAAAVLGAIVGAAVPWLESFLDSRATRIDLALPDSRQRIEPRHIAGSSVLMLLCFGLLAVTDLRILAGASVAITIAALASNRFALSTLFYPARFWMLFLIVGSLDLFFSYGTRIEALPFLTNEGLRSATAQALRLWAWLEAVFILRRLRFHTIFFELLRNVFPGKQSTLSAGLIALEFFPEIARISRSGSKLSISSRLRHPRRTIAIFLDDIVARVEDMVAGGQRDEAALPATVTESAGKQ